MVFHHKEAPLSSAFEKRNDLFYKTVNVVSYPLECLLFLVLIRFVQLDRHVPLFYLNFLLVLKLLGLLNKKMILRYPPTELQLFFQIYFHTIYQNLLL